MTYTERQSATLLDTLRPRSSLAAPRILARSQLAAELAVTEPRALSDFLHPLANAIAQGSRTASEGILKIMQSLKATGAVRLLSFLRFRKYDETPLTVNVRWRGDPDKELEPHAKVVVVASAWSMLVA